MTRCVACGEVMTKVEPDQAVHPGCFVFDSLDEDPFAALIKNKLTEIIRWADEQSPRSQQVEIGPSEMGDPCDRRIAYHLAAIPEVNKDTDPWAAIVGTAVHAWLEKAVTMWKEATGDDGWVTEQTVAINEFVLGHSDLYYDGTVLDWKTAGPEMMRKVAKGDIPPGYVIQTHLYGYGYELLGARVEKVAIAFLPRSGLLRNMIVWTADYDRSQAERALQRMYGIAAQIVQLDVSHNPHRWNQIEAEPSNMCGLCPWFSIRDLELGADHTGCPGR